MIWDLPADWQWKPISSLLTPVRRTAKPNEIRDEWTYVGLEHISPGTGEYTGVKAGSAGIRSNKFLFEPGDILYGKLRPNLRKCVVAQTFGVSSTDIVPLRAVEPNSAHFIALQLRSEPFTAEVLRLIGGANLPRVNIKDLFSLKLPTPPPEDAHRLYEMAKHLTDLRYTHSALGAAMADVESAMSAAALGLLRESKSHRISG